MAVKTVLCGQKLWMLHPMVELGWSGGLVIRTQENQLIFDPDSSSVPKQGCSVFVSHAHADHFAGLKGLPAKYSTLETRRIFERVCSRSVVNSRDIHLNKRIDLGDVEITPLNAGHILGSTQFLVSLPDVTILYTGDINYLDTLTTKKAENVECDILVVESTYGEPSYIFPDREEIYASIVEWALSQVKRERIPVFQVYATGKAQELVRLFNLYTNLNVTVSQKIAEVCSVYSDSNMKLDYEKIERDINEDRCIRIVSGLNSLEPNKHVRAIATGWALKMNLSKATGFPLSSHADFAQLVQFIGDCKAKVVYSFTGYNESFASYVRRKLDVTSRPLPVIAQKTLHQFC